MDYKKDNIEKISCKYDGEKGKIACKIYLKDKDFPDEKHLDKVSFWPNGKCETGKHRIYEPGQGYEYIDFMLCY